MYIQGIFLVGKGGGGGGGRGHNFFAFDDFCKNKCFSFFFKYCSNNLLNCSNP